MARRKRATLDPEVASTFEPETVVEEPMTGANPFTRSPLRSGNPFGGPGPRGGRKIKVNQFGRGRRRSLMTAAMAGGKNKKAGY